MTRNYNNARQVFWYIWNEDNAGDVNASHNWWDTVNLAVIEAYIMDRRDRSYLGLVNYLHCPKSHQRHTADDISAPVVRHQQPSLFHRQLGKARRNPCWLLLQLSGDSQGSLCPGKG